MYKKFKKIFTHNRYEFKLFKSIKRQLNDCNDYVEEEIAQKLLRFLNYSNKFITYNL